MGLSRNAAMFPLSFWEKVDIGSSECWNWLGGKNHYGYGRFGLNWTRRPAHQIAYELLVGKIPDGLELDHLCRNRACVNPSHLEPVTHKENLHRGMGWAGTKVRQTHCIRGHEFTPENTARGNHGRRRCAECTRLRYRKVI